MESRWNLFFDESGRFEDPDDEVAVAGLLVREDVTSFHSHRLRATLEEAVPALPWPLHSWLLYHPSYLLVVGRWRVDTWGEDEACERLGRDLIGHVRAAAWVAELAAQDVLERATAAVAAGREPKKADLASLDAALRDQTPGVFQLLRDDLTSIQASIDRVLQACSTQPDTLGAVNLVAAGEARRGDAQSHTDRYLALLECAVERAASSIAQRPGPAHIWLHALQRDVHDPVLGRGVPLHTRHLGPLCERVRQRVAPDRVRVVQATCPQYDTSVRGALVLADLVAHRSRHELGRRGSLVRVHRQLAKRLRGPALATESGLSHLASTGEPWSYLHRDGEGDEPSGRGWAVTQAIQWAPAWRGL